MRRWGGDDSDKEREYQRRWDVGYIAVEEDEKSWRREKEYEEAEDRRREEEEERRREEEEERRREEEEERRREEEEERRREEEEEEEEELHRQDEEWRRDKGTRCREVSWHHEEEYDWSPKRKSTATVSRKKKRTKKGSRRGIVAKIKKPLHAKSSRSSAAKSSVSGVARGKKRTQGEAHCAPEKEIPTFEKRHQRARKQAHEDIAIAKAVREEYDAAKADAVAAKAKERDERIKARLKDLWKEYNRVDDWLGAACLYLITEGCSESEQRSFLNGNEEYKSRTRWNWLLGDDDYVPPSDSGGYRFGDDD